ncbi:MULTISPECIES: photosynthetic complex putative assembly protein PuhB [unclassified Roseitalea]|uniref:photosynthetic complex putative assembly protein PuhB n=1 Tax=unclassified Roseitalea TaxID=2639107 RepID=UPI00273DED91|nr:MULTISPECIES: photosynthetic complex putative assembly protein PuhB [unclassified Roseitalea]
MSGMIATEFDEKANAGLPGPLPEGEYIVWQGAPQAGPLARHALKTRWIAGYFGVLLAWLVVTGIYYERAMDDIVISLAIVGAAGGAILGMARWYAWGVARTTVYTITTRRIVMKFGIALPKAFNLPYAEIEAVDVRERGGGLGDIALRFKPDVRLAWLIFWPHVRGLRMARTEPQLVCIQDVGEVADLLARQLHAHVARTHDVEQVLEGKPDDDAVVPFPQAAE